MIVYKRRMFLLYSFAFFFTTVLIGVLSSIYEDSFVRLILGDNYVNETMKNIADGDPKAMIYKADQIGGVL